MKKRMVAKLIVYVISITLIILSCVFFNDSIVLDASSAEPAIIIAVLIAQGYILRKDEFANQATKKPEHLSPEENRLMCKCISEASVYMIPINLFLIFFLNVGLKILISLASVFLAYVCGIIVFRLIYGNRVKKRIEKEEQELKEQKKREEQGEI